MGSEWSMPVASGTLMDGITHRSCSHPPALGLFGWGAPPDPRPRCGIGAGAGGCSPLDSPQEQLFPCYFQGNDRYSSSIVLDE